MKRILTRNLMYLYTSIFFAGIQNIVTQMFFDTNYPDNKETLMSAALFCGSIFSVLGIIASARVAGFRPSRRFDTKRPRLLLVTGMVLAILSAFSGLFFVKSFVFYTVLFSIACFCINYIYNILDVFITSNTESADKQRNVRVLLGYQMLGYMVAPLFFSTFVSMPLVCIGFAIIAGICGYLPSGSDYVKNGLAMSETYDFKAKDDGENDDTVTGKGTLQMCYCFLMFTGVYMLMPSVAYLLKDYLNVENYATLSSVFLAGIVLVSSVVILLCDEKKLWQFNITAPLSMVIALQILLVLRSSHAAVLICMAIVSGIGYGAYLSGSRYFVNAADPQLGLVTKYNKMLTAGSLFGYLLSAGVGFICEQKGFPVVPVKFSIIILFFAAASCVAVKLNSDAVRS